MPDIGEQLPRHGTKSSWRKGKRRLKTLRARALRRLGKRTDDTRLPTNRYSGWSD